MTADLGPTGARLDCGFDSIPRSNPLPGAEVGVEIEQSVFSWQELGRQRRDGDLTGDLTGT